MITEQEAIEAAKNIPAIALLEMSQPVRDVMMWATCELSRREADQAERAKPIDAEWCLANGAEQVGDCNMYRWKFCVVRIDWDAYNGTTIDESDGAWVWMPSITARGQLLDLLAALKGGAT